MPQFMTEDQVRDKAKCIMRLDDDEPEVLQGTGQMTTFNQLGIAGIYDKPDGWLIPFSKRAVAIILETKNSNENIHSKRAIDELLKNCKILIDAGYLNVVGILHNGYETIAYHNNEPMEVPTELQHKDFYRKKVTDTDVSREEIYNLARSINDNLHVNFGIKNLSHRMIFTACALVTQTRGAMLNDLKDHSFQVLRAEIRRVIHSLIQTDTDKNMDLNILAEVYEQINLNYAENNQAINDFIDDVCEIANCVQSSSYRAKDVTGIFFNEFNRYKSKSDAGQILTPEHITSLMYRALNITKNDYVGDFTCGSGAFLIKSMSNMTNEAGGFDTTKAEEIRANQLFGIEWDKEMYALACANMLIHKNTKAHLKQTDMRMQEACDWIKQYPISKVLMNPPYERKYGCMKIVENVLDNVAPGTDCAFILPDKKLEKTSKAQMRRILSHHRITKIIKLPENLFFTANVTTSIFVFKTGQPQNGQEIFGCYIENDGLKTVKNQGRHDVNNTWQKIEDYWIDSIAKRRDTKYDTAQWIDPAKHLSYQMPQPPFEIFEEDFNRTVMEYLCFTQNIDLKELESKVSDAILYGDTLTTDENGGDND